MGFMDKAKKFAEQAQQEAKDGTLKERAKQFADQAQAKLDEVQTQFNEGQKKGAEAEAGQSEAPAAPAPTADPDATVAAAETVQEAASEKPSAPAGGVADVDRSSDAAPKLTGGDPLAG